MTHDVPAATPPTPPTPSGAICPDCNLNMMLADGCTRNIIYIGGRLAGKFYPRLPYGVDGWTDDIPDGKRCHDCGCLKGHFHHFGCDMERCPKCHNQLIACDCADESVIYTAIDTVVPEPTPGANDALATARRAFAENPGAILPPDQARAILAALDAANERVAALTEALDRANIELLTCCPDAADKTLREAGLDPDEVGRNAQALADRLIAERNATAPTLADRLASGNRTIAPDELHDAIALIVSGKVQPIEGVDYVKMPTPDAGAAATKRDSLGWKTLRSGDIVWHGGWNQLLLIKRVNQRKFGLSLSVEAMSESPSSLIDVGERELITGGHLYKPTQAELQRGDS